MLNDILFWLQYDFDLMHTAFIVLSRPESNMLKNLPNMLPGISLKFHIIIMLLSLPIMVLHYAPKLLKILSIVIWPAPNMPA